MTTCSTASKTFAQEVREGLGGFLPRQPARPAGEEEHVGLGQGALAVAPRDFLYDDGAAAPAIYTPHCVQQEDEKSPEGNELKSPFSELVVTGSALMAARTDSGGSLPRPHQDLDALAVGTEASPMVDKSPKAVTAV